MGNTHKIDVVTRTVVRFVVVVACVLVTVASVLNLLVYPQVRAATNVLEARINCEEVELFRTFVPRDKQTPVGALSAYDFYNDCMKRFPGTMYHARSLAQSNAAILFRGAPE